ncbi:hypothetical protein Lal_00018909 [Lupinus albus]|uniref:Putative F-box domain, galactose oxidase/kelch, beta-propeller, F-box associated interaction n=1 Tax=Lupinus albus TaxID=3870 RepID=A0A6A5LKZ0_LUPAL|nr:putative F-box domain, galactose oxidase/kelch, beta-propeller, F-box associated interaction [Lupinus albus]KAF1863064.1 hypothetical protein Lal_00018909 [Lupinus albus]
MGGTAELGEDLVEYILLRLSVKSLVRFKCVDRSWDVLFKTPNFVQNHLHIHRNEEIFMIRQTRHYRWVTIVNNSTSTIDTTYLFPEFNYEINVDGSVDTFCTQGSCNGVFCICLTFDQEIIPGEGIHKLYLWNPATREVKVVPPPPLPYRSDKYKCIFGLGADPNSINGLEVVNLIFDYKNNSPPYVVLYNLITNSWTFITTDLISVVPDYYNCDLSGYLVKGVFYWIISLVFLDDDKILCFNFRNNQFHILKRPPTSVAFHLDFIDEVNDSTAYVVHGYSENFSRKVEIWILENDKWTKKYTFAPFEYLHSLFAIWKGGAEFLGIPTMGSSCFHIYNSDCQCIRAVNNNSGSVCFVYKYVESITSLSF